MSVLKNLFGYAAYMFSANVVTGLLTFGVTAFGMVARPKEAFGDYALYMRIYEIGQGIFIFGANASIQKFAAGHPENRARFSALALYLFFALLFVAGVAGIGLGLVVRWSYAFALFGLPWLVLYWWGRYLLRSELDAPREARLMMVASLSNSIFQFVFLTFTDLRDALIYGDFAALVMSGLFALAYVKGRTSFAALLGARPSRAFIEETTRFAIPLWWSGQIFQARRQIEGLWTRAVLGPGALGALQGRDTMWQFASRPLEYLGQAALPGLVSAKERSTALYRDLLRLCLIVFTGVGLLVALGIPVVFWIVDRVSAFFGAASLPMAQKYAEVPALLDLAAVAMPIVAFETVTNQFSVAADKPKAVLVANVATVIAVLGTIYPLTTRFGLVGVVVAGILGAAASALAYGAVLYRSHRSEMRTAVLWTGLAMAGAGVAVGVLHG